MSPAFHPVGTDDPRTVRWSVPPGWVPAVGVVAQAPAALESLVAAGVVAALRLTPDAVAITVGSGHEWRAVGATVRTALAAALDQPQEWRVEDGGEGGGRLAASLAMVIAGRAGDHIRSHGGAVTVEHVAGQEAWLTMGGACRHCPALVFTLQGTVERELKVLHPQPFRLHVNSRPPAP